MNTKSININAITNRVGRFGWVGFLGVCDGKLAIEDEMSCQAAMAVWAVMCIAAASSGCQQVMFSSLSFLCEVVSFVTYG